MKNFQCNEEIWMKIWIWNVESRMWKMENINVNEEVCMEFLWIMNEWENKYGWWPNVMFCTLHRNSLKEWVRTKKYANEKWMVTWMNNCNKRWIMFYEGDKIWIEIGHENEIHDIPTHYVKI